PRRPRPPRPTLFPYTTLFRSCRRPGVRRRGGRLLARRQRRTRPGLAAPNRGAVRRGRGRGDQPPARALRASATTFSTRPRTSFRDRKSTRLNSSHLVISYAVF